MDIKFTRCLFRQKEDAVFQNWRKNFLQVDLKFDFNSKPCKVLISVFCLLIFVNFGFSQTEIEKAHNLIKNAKNDTTKVNAINQFVLHFQNQDNIACMKYINQAIQLSKSLNFKIGLISSYRLKGTLFLNKSELDSAKKYLDLAWILVKNEKSYDFQKQAGLLKLNYGLIFQNTDKLDSATNYYIQSSIILNKIGANEQLFYPYLNLVVIYQFLKEHKKALVYAKKSYEVALRTKNKNKIVWAINNLMSAQFELKLYDSMAVSLKKNIVSATEISNYDQIGVSNNNLGQYYFTVEKNYPESIKYFTNSIKAFDVSGEKFYKSGVIQNLGEAYLKNNDLKNAEINLKKAIALAKELKTDNMQLQATNNLAILYEKSGQTQKALNYLKESNILKDSIDAKFNRGKVLEIETKFETEKKETQIKLQAGQLKQKTTNNLLLIGGIAALALLSLLVFLNYRNRQKIDAQKIKELEQEKQLTAVSSIMQGQEEERSRMARDLHDGLGGILSGIKLNLSAMRGNQIMQEADANIFSRSIDQLDTAIKEMRRVAHNMMPEALLKFGLSEAIQDFCDGINQAGYLKMKYSHFGSPIPNDQSLQVILYRIVQELSNNAIKYAQAQNILIQLTKHETGISLTVEDDGKGFDIANLEKIKGTGINNVISRVNYLKGTFTIDSEIGKGTSCFIEIPV